MRLAWLPLSLVMLVPVAASAWSSPDEALDRFLEFELSGGRTSEWSFTRYLDVSREYDEPGWDQVVLVESFARGPVHCVAQRCTAKVTFVLPETVSLHDVSVVEQRKLHSETVVFQMVRTPSGWLLEPFADYPHVSMTTYRAHLKRR